MSKVTEGWSRNRGRKCPVESGTLVDLQLRGGVIHIGKFCDNHTWIHTGEPFDVMYYRLHKPVDQVEACSKPDPCDSAKRDSDYVCWMRDRIAEIDATTQALTTKRAELVKKLASEGFALIGRAVEPVEDMSDWRNWKVGDIVECVSHNERWSAKFAIGSVNVIKEIITDSDVPVDLTINIGYYVSPFDFKWHSRPSA